MFKIKTYSCFDSWREDKRNKFNFIVCLAHNTVTWKSDRALQMTYSSLDANNCTATRKNEVGAENAWCANEINQMRVKHSEERRRIRRGLLREYSHREWHIVSEMKNSTIPVVRLRHLHWCGGNNMIVVRFVALAQAFQSVRGDRYASAKVRRCGQSAALLFPAAGKYFS